MPKYKLCPRCELNMIEEDKKLCDICLAQLANQHVDVLDDDEEELCQKCHLNPVEPGQKYCADCLANMQSKGIDLDSVVSIDEEEGVEKVNMDVYDYDDITSGKDSDYDDPNPDEFEEDDPEIDNVSEESIFDDDDIASAVELEEDEEQEEDEEVSDEEYFEDDLEKDFQVSMSDMSVADDNEANEKRPNVDDD